MKTAIDHLVVGGGTLGVAADHLETALGSATVAGGAHARMGTHNRLLSLGPELYVEALAADPAAPAPGHPRWFGLDAFADAGAPAPRLAAWALRVEDIDDVIGAAPEDIGSVVSMQRGAYRWRITVPGTGRQPFDGLYPALIAWDGPDPAAALPDSGLRLVSLTLRHPDPGSLGWALSMLTDDDRVVVREGPVGLSALVHGPDGERVLE